MGKIRCCMFTVLDIDILIMTSFIAVSQEQANFGQHSEVF